MIVLRILLLGMVLLVIPTIVGSIFAKVDKDTHSLPFAWISGHILLWAGFQVIAVPVILKEGRFTQIVQWYLVYMALLVAGALILLLYRKRRQGGSLRLVKEKSEKAQTKYYIVWGLFWGLLVFQLIQSVFLSYADSDDAYYVAIASISENSNSMYRNIAYTGKTSELNARYGLAPFPLWLSFLARISGIRTVSVAHVIVPPVLIAMTYGIYYVLGKRLFHKNKDKLPLFLIFVEFLVLFGDYSMYTPEKFVIARSRQGKAALAGIVIPMLLFLLLMLMEKIQESQRISIAYWALLACVCTVSCLCSTLGAMLSCMLIGIVGLCAAFSYRKWKFLLPMAACCIPCVVEALLYFKLG